MPEKQSSPPQTLVHFTSGVGGKKNIATEVVKPGSASAQFLQRMEKNKQTIPCHQAIDLRKTIKGDIFEYEYQGITHYLDSQSIENFENLLVKYHYIYTLDIYKIIISAAQQQNAIIKKNERFKTKSNSTKSASDASHNQYQASDLSIKLPLTIIPFGYHRHQNEIRMLHISKIQIQAKDAAHWFEAKTINISVSGLKIKSVVNMRFKERQAISIKFTGLSEKFSSECPAIDYKIVDIYHQDNQQICSLVRISRQHNEAFSSKLANFIENNQKRYKIDLDDFIESTKARVFERIYSQDTQHPSVFIHDVDGNIKLKHILCNDHFQSSSNLLPILSNKATDLKIPQWDSKNSSPLLINIFSFTIENETGKEQLYCALDSSFSCLEEKQNFLSMAINSKNFNGWQLIIQPCQLLDETVATSFLSDLEELSIAESERLQLELKTVVAIGKLVEVHPDTILEILNINSAKQAVSIDLSPFLCSQENSHHIEIIKVAQQKQRNENRYLLTTAVEVKIYGEEYKGHTLDFSPNGIKLKLDVPIPGKIRDSADISFPGLQNKFKKENLENQHFRIAHISVDGLTVCFSRDRRFILHEASIFFRRLIDCNLHKLTQCSGDTYRVVRSTLFEKLMVQNLASIPFFISIKNHRLQIEYISANENSNTLLWSFHDKGRYNFDTIFSGKTWGKILEKCSQNNSNISTVFETKIYLSKKHLNDSWQVHLSEDFPDTQSLNKYLRQFQMMKYKKVLRFSIAPSASYNQNLIVDELHEIRSNSINQYQQFKKQLKRIKAVGELIDVTDGVMATIQKRV